MLNQMTMSESMTFSSANLKPFLRIKPEEFAADLQLQMRVFYLSQVLAGLAIMSSYALVLTMGSALVSSFALVVCVAGFGMYGSANEFSIFMRAQFGEMPLKNEEQAGWEWLAVWTKFTFTPLVLAGAFTLGWPVGVMAALLVAARPYLPSISSCMSTPAIERHDVMTNGVRIETPYDVPSGLRLSPIAH